MRDGRELLVLALRPREVCKVLNISRRTLWDWTRKGLIPHVRLNGYLLYPTALLESWLREQAARQAGNGGVAKGEQPTTEG